MITHHQNKGNIMSDKSKKLKVKVKKHLVEDVKESKKSINDDKKLMKKVK